MIYNALRVLVLVKRALRPPMFVDAQSSSARVATFQCIINFSKQGGKTVILCFWLCSNIPSASHSLAGASLESSPKVSENSSWRNAFHAMWVECFRPGKTFCQPPNVKYAGELFICWLGSILRLLLFLHLWHFIFRPLSATTVDLK